MKLLVQPHSTRRNAGVALLTVLVLLFVIAGSSASFIWFMNQQQTRVGTRLRSAEALAVAEAGVYRALSILEPVASSGGFSGRTWRPTEYSEVLPVGPFEGRFTLSLSDEPDGAILITSTGKVAGTTRRLRARVYLASRALLAGLYGASLVRVERPPAAIFILPYGGGLVDRPWIHIAAGQEIWFATTNVSINDPTLAFDTGPGPADALDSTRSKISLRPEPVRLLLGRHAELTLDRDRQRVDVQQLRVMGAYVEGAVLRTEVLPPPPEIDRAFYKVQAANNASNAELNETAGRYVGDRNLVDKRDSLYSREQFGQLMAYLQTGRHPPRLHGVIYIQGGLELSERQQMQIVEGALVVERTLLVSEDASLEVTHSASTRTLPGIIVLDNGALVITRNARLRAHGLVYVNRVIYVGEGAQVDIVGAVVGKDEELSFRNHAATVAIRYDPAVLGTPGLRVPDDTPVVGWVAKWEELP